MGAVPKIGETLWYAGQWRGQWVGLMGFSCSARNGTLLEVFGTGAAAVISPMGELSCMARSRSKDITPVKGGLHELRLDEEPGG